MLRIFAATTCVLLMMVSTGFAQTDLALMTKPWRADSPLDIGGGVSGFNTDLDGTTADLDLTFARFAGRVRPDRESDHAFTIGFDVIHLELDTADPLLPERLHSSAVAVGAKLGGFEAFDHGWEWGATLGVGHASSNPFGDGDGWYALGSVFANTQLDEKSTLLVGVDFDGNRVVFPDLPLPSILYQTRYSETLTLALGFPVNQIVWTPDERWTIQAGVAGIAFNARATYALQDNVRLFTSYGGDGEGFHVADDDSDRRLFYTAQKVEGGVELGVTEQTSLVIAGGFAFDQEFERGFDLRDTDTVRELDDAAYFRVGGRVDF